MDIPPREVTQARLDELAARTLQHTPAQSYTVGDRFEEKASAHPDKTFLFFEDRTVSYGELNAEANRVAHWARGSGLRMGDVVALMMENRPEFIMTWAGLVKLGITVALVNTNVRGRPLQHAIETTGAKRVVVGSECLRELGDGAGALAAAGTMYVAVDPAGEAATLPAGATDLGSTLATMSTENPDPAVRDGFVAGRDLFYIFTSGTTGLPKAARLSHMRYLGVGDCMSWVGGYGPDDVIACVLPLYHGAGGMVVVSSALAQGAAIALRRRFSASAFWDDARRYGTTAFQYVGEICRYLLNQPPFERDRDHAIEVMMGAGLTPSVWRRFQERFGIERIFEGWSSTEANTIILNIDRRPGSCGRIPFPDRHNGRLIRYDVETDRHVRDDAGFCVECAPGEVGEFIGMILDIPGSGAGRFEGYTSAEETQKKILHDVFQKGDAWYRSGDLLYHDEDDYYYFVDRLGDTYRWKSENVSTQEVAELLGELPGVELANVYGVKVPDTEGKAGMAALVLHDPSTFDPEEFFAGVADRLPSYAAPVFVRLVQEADITSTFKLRKIDLERDGYDLERVRDPIFVRDEPGKTYRRLTAANRAALLPR